MLELSASPDCVLCIAFVEELMASNEYELVVFFLAKHCTVHRQGLHIHSRGQILLQGGSKLPSPFCHRYFRDWL